MRASVSYDQLSVFDGLIWLRETDLMDCSNPRLAASVEGADVLSFVTTGNAVPVLHEVKHALAQLLKSGQTCTIDLGALPFAPGDMRQLDEILGQGEVHATLNALGESFVRETSIPGVWRVDHHDDRGELQSRFIEVTFMPEILKTHPEDSERGLEILSERLKAL
jgi:hydrogenase-1 operon protein HyaF